MRITSRRNLLFAAIGVACGIFFVFSYVHDVQGDKSLWIFLGVELLLAAHSLFWLNFVDIYQEADDKLRCYFYGKRFEVPSDRRIGRFLFSFIQRGFKFYFIGYISFRDRSGKRRHKFFIMADRDWHLIGENEFN